MTPGLRALIYAGALTATPALAQEAVLLFGGVNHQEFLGCLTCGQYDSNSVWAVYSEFGWNNRYGKWSRYGDYKSPYNSFSACNAYADDPPVMVDRLGAYYGRLTINAYTAGSVCGIGGNPAFCRALKVMCARD